jgi:pilus assembly protein CpaB
MLGERSVPAKWAPTRAIRDPSQVAGLVAGVDLPAGTELQEGMLIAPPALTPGKREVAIYVDPETGVAGQITPGSLVDIIATFQGNTNVKPYAKVIVASAKVLSVGAPTTSPGSSSASSQAVTQNQVVPVTFSLTPSQALAVSGAETLAEKLRLSLVAPGTTGPPVYPPAYSPAP